jgi:6-phosphogluconolactonase (cycloisomerase 2 family)
MLLASFAIIGGSASASALSRGPAGAVYTLTNAAAGNEVAVFNRAADGTLTPAYTVPTGGLGTGTGLGSQGALAMSNNGRWLFAVNAGSNDISVLATGGRGVKDLASGLAPDVRHDNRLHLVSRTPSGGTRPISLTSNGNILYVLNAGVPNNISGFRVNSNGTLDPIDGSTQPLSAADSGPAEVRFSSNGRVLLVTEKSTNMLDTYTVSGKGVASPPNVQASAGTTPFGFAFDNRNHAIVSEAFGGAANASAASSYNVNNDGILTTITASAPTYQTAACWVAISKDNRFAYTANTGSGNITGYSISDDGSLTLLDPSGISGVTGSGSAPADLAVTGDGKFLYVLDGGTHAFSGFAIAHDGSLTPVDTTMGLIPGSAGLVSR